MTESGYPSVEVVDAALKAVSELLGQAALAGDPPLRPVVMVLGPSGEYRWRATGIRRHEILKLLGRIVQELSEPDLPQHYACSVCTLVGHQHGLPPAPGWVWSSKGKLVCDACRAAVTGMKLAPPVELVDSDEPDLGQAPSTLMVSGPSVLFLDDDPEDAPMPCPRCGAPAFVPHVDGCPVTARQAEEGSQAPAVPLTMRPSEAAPTVVEVRQATDEEQHEALEREVRRLVKQERNGG